MAERGLLNPLVEGEAAQLAVQRLAHVERAGHVIADVYRLEEQLGRGAMGRIWRAEHARLGSKVALKFLDPTVSDHPEALERFVREARSAAAVRSAHVVQIFDYGIHEGVPYISMELLEGESLDKRLRARRTISASELSGIFSGIAQAVDTAHEAGVIHRDLKPGNIFLARERDTEIAKVLDFGIAKLTNRALDAAGAAGTQTGVMLGTPYYMSPEQVRGSRSLDHRTDLWSLAVIAFECLTGELPFSGDSVGDIIVQICTSRPKLPSELAAVPPGLDEWFLKGTSKDPAARFATARQMAEALREILDRAPVPAAQVARSRTGTAVVPASTPVPASQSTGPITAPIAAEAQRAAASARAHIGRRNVGVAAAIALACVISAIVLWAFPPRRASSGLQTAASAPARSSSAPPAELREGSSSSSAPPAELREGGTLEHSSRNTGASIEAAAGSPAPEPKGVSPLEPALDAAELDTAEPLALEPARPSRSAGTRQGGSQQRGKQGVRGARQSATKKAARSAPRRRTARPKAAPPAAPRTSDPFSERQ